MNDRPTPDFPSPEAFRSMSELLAQAPSVLRELRDVVYTPAFATQLAATVAAFYKGLLADGVPPDVALVLTKRFTPDLRALLRAAADDGVDGG